MPWNPLSCACGKYYLPQRIIMVIFMQLALLNAYNLRVVLNIAMTEMIAPSNDSHPDACPNLKADEIEIHDEQFEWTSNEEAMILYAFYIGYIFSHMPGGILADKFGSRHVMGCCMVASAVLTVVYPLTLRKGGKITAIVLRALLGLFQGPIFPTISTFIQCWIPPRERSLLGALAFAGSNLGTVVGSIFTGMMIKHSGLWSLPFYVWGGTTLVWYLFYILFVYSHPDTHPFLTEREAEYLADSIEREKKQFKVPWIQMLKCPSIWALLFGQCAHNLLFFIVLTDLPKYLKEILKMNIQNNAIYTAIPFALLWLFIFLFGFLADLLIRKEWLSVRQTRITFTAISIVFPSSLLVLTTYVGCNRLAAVVTYTIGILLLAPFFSGMKVNVNDVTVHYAGTIMAFVNGLGAIAAIVGPAIVGGLSDDESLESWQTIYWIMFGSANFCGLIYYIFARGERQSWDFPEDMQ